ncbi:ADP compounds hydrolase NudE [Thalassotalea agarivorans]|uniref:ADP-ribose diphosphatase n=1 Tax=Thalassotalea agarivorans TaxID=349064 RepID=A0A1I0CVR1_THASX|nr:ADP compounds hydrolase NudE [Thalassotalea agarivorans]SET23386.1 ADP-ribose diphosphatase [Thalassotalea agarivorans]
MTKDKALPKINGRKEVARSRIFAIESVDLTFSNGETRVYERMMGKSKGAVMVIPMLDDETMLLVREYCGGTHSYELGFPKGLVDEGEQAVEAANRELKEEIHYGARSIEKLHSLSMAPAFFDAHMDIFVANNLYPESLPGDEPEPLEIVPWKVSDYHSLLAQPDFKEARSIAALMLFVDSQKEST